PCLFLQGASGDLGPCEGFVGDPAVADRNGRQLGYAVLAALESLSPPLTRFEYQGPVVSGATLGTWAHVPLDERSRQVKGRSRLRSGRSGMGSGWRLRESTTRSCSAVCGSRCPACPWWWQRW